MGCCYSFYLNQQLKKQTSDVPLFDFKGETHQVKVVDVYDGDTFTIAGRVAYNPELFQFQVRVNGIDTPEKRTNNENEKYVANIAKEFVKEKIMDKIVELHGVTTDKYGRLLADVVYKGENIGQELIKNRLAVAYDGGTKNCPDDWKKYYEDSN